MIPSKILTAIFILSLFANLSAAWGSPQKINLSLETKEMLENYKESELGKYIQQNPEDFRSLQIFSTELNTTALSLMGKIYLNLAQMKIKEGISDHFYTTKEAEYISLYYCRDQFKFFRKITSSAKVNAESALSYIFSSQKCDNPLLKDYFLTQKEQAKTWRDFILLVEKSLPVNDEKKEAFFKFYEAQISKTVGNYLSRFKAPSHPAEPKVPTDNPKTTPLAKPTLRTPKYTVEELQAFRDDLEALKANAFENCPDGDLTGIHNDHKDPANYQKFLKALQGILNCARHHYKDDNQKFKQIVHTIHDYSIGRNY